MSLDIPTNPLSTSGFHGLPASYATALDGAAKLLAEQTAASNEEEWQDAGINQDVQLHRKDNPDNAYDVPWVRGVAIIEGATPAQVLATVQLPGMRKKWDPRFDFGAPIERYEPQSYLFYSVMKSPSYFIWARDIAGVQRNLYDHPSKGSITVLQTSVENDEHLPDAGSYAKSRTRATVELSAWLFEPTDDGSGGTKVTYIVKVHLNGSIPTSVVSMIATETPMCVARVRDTFYSTGFAPHDVHRSEAELEGGGKTQMATMDFDDGDGSEASAGERRWTGTYLAQGPDQFEVAYDGKRMYPDGVEVQVTGDASGEVTAETSEGEDKVKVSVKEGAKGKFFQVVITPKE